MNSLVRSQSFGELAQNFGWQKELQFGVIGGPFDFDGAHAGFFEVHRKKGFSGQKLRGEKAQIGFVADDGDGLRVERGQFSRQNREIAAREFVAVQVVRAEFVPDFGRGALRAEHVAQDLRGLFGANARTGGQKIDFSHNARKAQRGAVRFVAAFAGQSARKIIVLGVEKVFGDAVTHEQKEHIFKGKSAPSVSIFAQAGAPRSRDAKFAP